MTPRTGRPKLPDDEKRVKDTFSMTAGERSLVEEAIEKEGVERIGPSLDSKEGP